MASGEFTTPWVTSGDIASSNPVLEGRLEHALQLLVVPLLQEKGPAIKASLEATPPERQAQMQEVIDDIDRLHPNT
jgi:hypothetical protein